MNPDGTKSTRIGQIGKTYADGKTPVAREQIALNEIQAAEPNTSVEFYDYEAPFPSETGIPGWPVEAPLGIPGVGEGGLGEGEVEPIEPENFAMSKQFQLYLTPFDAVAIVEELRSRFGARVLSEKSSTANPVEMQSPIEHGAIFNASGATSIKLLSRSGKWSCHYELLPDFATLVDTDEF
jgi:hypothetical protein